MVQIKSENDTSLSLPGTSEDEYAKQSVGKAPWIGQRHIQVLLYFCILTMALTIEASMSVAIIAMMDSHINSNAEVPSYPKWTSKNIILSSFYWIYAILQLFSGIFVHKYGSKWFLVGGSIACSLLYIILPQTAACFGSTGVILLRMLQGATQSVYFSSVHRLLSEWAPAEERSTLGSLAYSGTNFGIVISMWFTGRMAGSHYGWPLIFYVYGGVGVVFGVLGAFVIYESPAVCPHISEAEKFYIENSLGHLDATSHPQIPWTKILTSAPFWALLISNCGDMYGINTLITQIPSYLSKIMDFDVNTSSSLLALPYISLIIMTPVFSVLADYIIARRYMSITMIRKIWNTIGLVAPALALFYMSLVKLQNPVHFMVLLTVVIGINASPSSSGWIVNHMDLSPNYADSMMGLTSGAANICVLISPLVVDFLVTDELNKKQWNRIFVLTALVYLGTAIFYIIFGSGKVQSWNEEDCGCSKQDGDNQIFRNVKNKSP